MGRLLLTLFLPFGRAPRWQFVFMLLFSLAMFIPISGLALRVAQVEPPDVLNALGNVMPGGIIGQGAAAVVGIYFLLVAFATRLHDRGRTGFWVILWLLLLAIPIGAFLLPTIPAESIPFVIPPETTLLIADSVPYVFMAAGALWAWMLIFCIIFPGTHGRNWFGRDPSGDEVDAVVKAEKKDDKAEAAAAKAAAMAAAKAAGLVVVDPSGN
jgi:uncharacterized membrane protein YhaH (DUF805 family)